MLKAYKYRMYPTAEQEMLLNKHFGCCRFIYNWALDQKQKHYAETQKSISAYDIVKKLPDLKKEKEWLSEVYSQSLQKSVLNLDVAFTNFFKKKSDFPKFKTKHHKQSFQYPQNVEIDFDKEIVILPKIKEVKIALSRKFKGQIKTCTVSKTTTGKFFISILTEDKKELPPKPKIDPNKTIGIDLGLTNFIVTSDGTKVSNPKFGLDQRRLKRWKRELARRTQWNGTEGTKGSRIEKSSQNRLKIKRKIAREQEKVVNQRTDFLHKLSTKLIRENQTICLEDLNVQGMMKNHCLANSIGRASWSQFESMLKYKSDWQGKNFIQIGRFEPSSKLSNCCGARKDDLKLSDRVWKCPKCQKELDRDVNAAQNIKLFALQKQNLINQVPVDSRDIKSVERTGCKQSRRSRNQIRENLESQQL